jgi:hypothetical protein
VHGRRRKFGASCLAVLPLTLAGKRALGPKRVVRMKAGLHQTHTIRHVNNAGCSSESLQIQICSLHGRSGLNGGLVQHGPAGVVHCRVWRSRSYTCEHMGFRMRVVDVGCACCTKLPHARAQPRSGLVHQVSQPNLGGEPDPLATIWRDNN